MSELLSKLWTIYQAKPAQVTVLSSGALLVDANQLLSSEEAKKQIAALQDFPTVQEPPAPAMWSVHTAVGAQPEKQQSVE